MASKRISMKGRGADLFFGDYTPPEGAPTKATSPPDDVQEVATTPPPPATSTDSISEAWVDPRVVAEFAPLGDTAVTLADKSGPQANPHGASKRASTQASEQASVQASKPVGKQAIGQAGTQAVESNSGDAPVLDGERASTPAVSAETVELIRRAVKEPGREVAYVRLTPEEKAQVAAIVYDHKRTGWRTTDNEVCRIAINHLLHDFHERGPESVLARVLASLHG